MSKQIQLASRPNTPVVLWIVALTCLPEVVLTILGTDLLGQTDLRRLALIYMGFWNGLLGDLTGVYPLQREVMFISYAFLHSGFLHLIGNMIAVLGLGGIVVARIGERGFLLLYALCTLGGAAGFALLSTSTGPMIGASGAVFGLIGAWKFWEWQARRAANAPMRPLWMSLVGLTLLNLILWVALSGLLAWEAHLGGFIIGVLFAAIVTPSMRHRI
ncbi:rhomboid family intramembrane serine protease [Roseicitreum antarcticum]|nr:rhomboid family intramembrane serine protease [Roseicitreum antarcticum]